MRTSKECAIKHFAIKEFFWHYQNTPYHFYVLSKPNIWKALVIQSFKDSTKFLLSERKSSKTIYFTLLYSSISKATR